MAAGQLSERVVFRRQAQGGSVDAHGNVLGVFDDFLTVWGDLREVPGKEALAAGRLESSRRGTLRVRISVAARAITAADVVVARGETWAILSGPVQVDRAGSMMEFTIEAGVAT